MSNRRRARLPPSDELRERFGANLATCRKQAQLSQAALALRAELHLTSISSLEAGRNVPHIETLLRLAGALEVPPNELSAGIAWEPAEAVIKPGAFEVPPDPALAAEIAALRARGQLNSKLRRDK